MALDGGEWSASNVAVVPRGKIAPPYPLGGPQGRSGRCGQERNVASAGIEFRSSSRILVVAREHTEVSLCSMELSKQKRKSLACLVRVPV
jgi:hypothetical protein